VLHLHADLLASPRKSDIVESVSFEACPLNVDGFTLVLDGASKCEGSHQVLIAIALVETSLRIGCLSGGSGC
jgi:hypothetical protein